MKYVIGGVHLTVRLLIHSKPGIEGILTLSIDWAGMINSHVICHLTPVSFGGQNYSSLLQHYQQSNILALPAPGNPQASVH